MIDYVITGGSGFIGTNLVHFLLQREKSIKIIDIIAKHKSTVCADVSFRLPFFSGNELIHLAAKTNIRDSILSPRSTFEKNCCGILNCLDLLKSSKFNHLIFTSSSSSAFASSPYLASKVAGEAACKAYKDSFGLNIKVLKLSSVYGPHSVHKESVIHKFIRRCIRHEPLTIYGKGDSERDFIYVSDVVDSIYYHKEGHIATGALTSIKLLAEKITEISTDLLKFTPKIHHENEVKGEVKFPQAKSDIIPKVGLDEGLHKTFEWYLENYEPK